MSSKSEEVKKLEPIFTTNPAELKGEIINVSLKKYLTLGIVCDWNRTCAREFVQVERVILESPAHVSGVLPGDIIVYINQKCILGTTGEDVDKILTSFSVGDVVNFQFCRGYAFQESIGNRSDAEVFIANICELVKMLTLNLDIDSLTERAVVSGLALMTKHVCVEEKIKMGETGIIEIITKLVDDKFMVDGWYEIMEVGWSFLFSIIGKYKYFFIFMV
ncbi:unnamed protein product [Meloidogyne enterolobii]|uniref:Uncharacterized protein n=1 Tax=Meloidogyne enterolobii TaxID=390850 RepID=A0ACB1ATZ7_MELEN